jgi:hypothetical protein
MKEKKSATPFETGITESPVGGGWLIFSGEIPLSRYSLETTLLTGDISVYPARQIAQSLSANSKAGVTSILPWGVKEEL